MPLWQHRGQITDIAARSGLSMAPVPQAWAYRKARKPTPTLCPASSSAASRGPFHAPGENPGLRLDFRPDTTAPNPQHRRDRRAKAPSGAVAFANAAAYVHDCTTPMAPQKPASGQTARKSL